MSQASSARTSGRKSWDADDWRSGCRRNRSACRAKDWGNDWAPDTWWPRGNYCAPNGWSKTTHSLFRPLNPGALPLHGDLARQAHPAIAPGENRPGPKAFEIAASPSGSATQPDLRSSSVAFQVSLRTVRTRSTVQMSNSPTATGSVETLTSLRNLAMRGAPLTREDRLVHQRMASH